MLSWLTFDCNAVPPSSRLSPWRLLGAVHRLHRPRPGVRLQPVRSRERPVLLDPEQGALADLQGILASAGVKVDKMVATDQDLALCAAMEQ